VIGLGGPELVLLALLGGVWLWALADAVRIAIVRPGLGEVGLVIAIVVGSLPAAVIYLLLRLTLWSGRWDRRRAARAVGR
jgi:hypothetical protein